MKTISTILGILFLAALTACDDSHNGNPVEYDMYAPLPPVGIHTTSLDNAVRLDWIENQEPDIDGYNILVSDRYDGTYTIIGSSRTATFLDQDAINGVTYYYAVTAYDFSGNESDLSRDVVYDTPRPEGLGVQLLNRFVNAARSGYDFSQYRIVPWDAHNADKADIFIEFINGVPFIVVWEDADIQDMGYTIDLDEITVAPEAGWSPTGDAHLIAGHTYVVWTADNHFAKVRIREIGQNYVTFDWAYQTAVGNPELLRPDDSKLSKTTRRQRHTARGH
jgi:hypothetical protein